MKAPARGARPWLIWTGRVLSALPVLLLLTTGAMGLKGSPEMTAAFTGHLPTRRCWEGRGMSQKDHPNPISLPILAERDDVVNLRITQRQKTPARA